MNKDASKQDIRDVKKQITLSISNTKYEFCATHLQEMKNKQELAQMLKG